MIHVNLLPEELRKIERVRRVKADIAMLSGGAIAVGVLIAVIAFVVVGRRMSQLAQVKARLNQLTAQREEADALLKKKLELTMELEILDGFTTRKLLWHRRLNEVSDAVPEDCVLTRLNYSSQPTPALTIKGEAAPGHGNKRVVEFIDSLHLAPAFLKEFPRINYSIESIEQGRKSFEITCARLKKEEKK
ncbi:MAG: PilN domain-containing protein [Candidatus Aureabacteria bacterium]|nr:PilN domain-containing protein [Candidatus Auribacterota bacterium]